MAVVHSNWRCALTDMFIATSVKNLVKNYRISATFKHDGVQYEERFNKLRGFLTKIKRTHDIFVCAVDYKDYSTIYPYNLRSYINAQKINPNNARQSCTVVDLVLAARSPAGNRTRRIKRTDLESVNGTDN